MEDPACSFSTWAECSEIAKDVTRKYAAHYAFERVRVEYVEEVFRLFIGEKRAPLTFRVDLVIRDTGGQVWFVDHKSTGKILSSHPKSYSMSGQFMSYTTAGRLIYGDQFGGCLLNMIEAGRGAPRFERPNLLGAPGLLAGFPASVERVWGEIQKLSDTPAGYWPIAPTEHTCWTRYGACNHYDNCRLGLKR